MKHIIALLICLNLLHAEDSFDRVSNRAQSTEKWKQATTLGQRLWAIHAIAERCGVATDPVSDRYLITRYGGPIDFLHFLAMAATVCEGRDAEKTILEQWKIEGGPDFEAGRTRSYPTEAHPDDLPSNAFGALIGNELRPHNRDLAFPVVETIRMFFDSLSPYPDRLIKKYSHDVVVMGFTGNPTMAERYQKSEWFTAQPIFLLPRLEPGTRPMFADSRAALQYAGYDLFQIEGRPLGIKRISQPTKTEQSGGGRR